MQADQINCLKLLETLDFLLDLASRQLAPEFPQGGGCGFLMLLSCSDALP